MKPSTLAILTLVITSCGPDALPETCTKTSTTAALVSDEGQCRACHINGEYSSAATTPTSPHKIPSNWNLKSPQ